MFDASLFRFLSRSMVALREEDRHEVSDGEKLA
jgi:hypothetical protein